MKKKIIEAALWLVLIISLAFSAIAPGMMCWIPFVPFMVSVYALLYIHDYI